ncbi:hypothetical protein DB346_02720 [Verrucomicrobia bacterium LW23]|nr:hypothetical protein DB346_03935 [Verrucomicrobia bacterium LW23]PTY04361.1 hypothetical protein DB346_02720 [Verrucomicrobia bacterium LW23]
MKSESPWIQDMQPNGEAAFPALNSNLSVDALVIGGGITGVTAAYLLRKSGKNVALVERGTIGCGETGHTTAHIAYPTDMRLKKLVSTIGREPAQAAWHAQRAAIDKITEIVAAEALNVDMRTVPAFLCAARGLEGEALENEVTSLQEEAELAREMGFDASFQKSCPGVGHPSIVFSNQHKFNAGKYLSQLAQCIPGNGCHVFENTAVAEIKEVGDSLQAHCGKHIISATHVFVATHVPRQGIASTLSASMFQTKISAYSSYAIQAALPPGQAHPEALIWDTAEPYLYIRIDRDADGAHSVIIGGEDHKTGQSDDTEACFARLEKTLRDCFTGARPLRRWSGQVIETNDGLPYVGEIAKGQYIATGYSGTGMTWGTVAAHMFHDHVTGADNPWKGLLSATRTGLPSLNYVAENKDYPYYYAKSFFVSTRDTVTSLKPGEGKLIRHNGMQAAAYCDDQGEVSVCSATCPHMGCTVAWNAAEKTWDCPCHGSRFTARGEVMAGPAESNLKPLADRGSLRDRGKSEPGKKPPTSEVAGSR